MIPHLYRSFSAKETYIYGSFVENDPSSLSLIFRKRDLYLVALLWKMIPHLYRSFSTKETYI